MRERKIRQPSATPAAVMERRYGILFSIFEVNLELSIVVIRLSITFKRLSIDSSSIEPESNLFQRGIKMCGNITS